VRVCAGHQIILFTNTLITAVRILASAENVDQEAVAQLNKVDSPYGPN
jgi:hypothetical protein